MTTTPSVQSALVQLQSIAQDATGSPARPNIADVEAKAAIEKSEMKIGQLKKTYTNPTAVFQMWKQNAPDITDGTRDYYWNTYESLHPEGKVGARDSVKAEVDFELRTRATPSDQEGFLRDRLTQLPEWAQEEYGNTLLSLSSQAARQNLFKSKASYQKDLRERVSRFNREPLDPDVPAYRHIEEITRLEQMGLLDSAAVYNGRLVLTDKEGQLRPAFSVNSRSEIFETDDFGDASIDEEMIVSELAPSIVKPVVERNLRQARAKIAEQNSVINMQTHKAMANGEFQRSQWGEAFSVMTDPIERKLITAISGEIEAGRVKTDAELAHLVFDALAEFGDTYAT